MNTIPTATITMAPQPSDSQIQQMVVAYTNPPSVIGVPPSLTKLSNGHQVPAESTEDAGQGKQWTTEQTVELIQLYKKHLPEFHTSGQRKVNVWQRVKEEMAAKGYTGLSWAEYSSKFRDLRDSYRRMTTGGHAQVWPYYALMKDVMKTEMMILERALSVRPQKGTITCENEIRTQNLQITPFSNTGTHSVQQAQDVGVSTNIHNAGHNSDKSIAGNVNDALYNSAKSVPNSSQTEDRAEELGIVDESVDNNCSRKRRLTEPGGPSSKQPQETVEQGEVTMTIGRNFRGVPVKVKTPKTQGAMGILGSMQALGKSLCLPQSQLVVADDGQILQTTSTSTGLFVNESGYLSSKNQPLPGRQTAAMPQWFKLYERRTRAENNRRLKELKEMHQESLQLQCQALEVAQQKNELLKTLMDSLVEFKALLAVLHR